jgi:hypothetical protein
MQAAPQPATTAEKAQPNTPPTGQTIAALFREAGKEATSDDEPQPGTGKRRKGQKERDSGGINLFRPTARAAMRRVAERIAPDAFGEAAKALAAAMPDWLAEFLVEPSEADKQAWRDDDQNFHNDIGYDDDPGFYYDDASSLHL